MHALAFNVLRAAPGPILRRSCRVIGGVRYPIPRRTFQRSAINRRIPEDSAVPEREKRDFDADNQSPEVATPKLEDEAKDVENGLNVIHRGRNGRSGVGRARANRQRQPEGLPPLTLPSWFFQKNVKCVGDPGVSGSLAVYGTGTAAIRDDGEDGAASNDEVKQDLMRQMTNVAQCGLVPTREARYSIHVDVYQEILATLRAGLVLRPPKNPGNQPISRPATLLQCPKDGGMSYLDSIVETAATKLGADLIKVDATDLASMVGSYVDENPAWTRPRISTLGYEAQKIAGKLEEYDKDHTAQEEVEGMEDEDDMGKGIKIPGLSVPKPSEMSKRLQSIFGALRGESGQQQRPDSRRLAGGFPIIDVIGMGMPSESSMPPASSPETDHWNNLKLNAVLEALISAADMKREIASESTSDPESVDSSPRDIIIQIKDMKEMVGNNVGSDLISRFRSLVNKRWQDGRNIICIGTSASEEAESALSRPEIQHLQSDIDGEKRTIFVPPDRREEQDIAFEADEKARIRNINVRHIEEMISKMAEGTNSFSIPVDVEKDLDSVATHAAGLEDAVWTFPRVHRLATTILGLDSTLSSVDGPLFNKALKILSSSDEVKFTWGAEELKHEDAEVEHMENEMGSPETSKDQQTKEKIKQIKKNCTSHEKKLLGGIVVPGDIKTTFDDVRAPKETIEALKTLTSLSLIRPEAFSYGVLATDKIPGLLLYGPPGTGKTLLAKAVAKESGATVLEVSGADVNDMFVGEGEKNVKAVFSLAKKLSPCVVFIDEADAIFASRGEAKRTGSHRELINQFLREWDGMNDLSAFMMVATNRPFDLDEAVLRRLPRRLLVDLPVEKDREAILKIHLKDEALDDSVSLAKIAKDTALYSGSDLKNISVAAALACIREENDAASKHTGDEPYVFPEKRILRKPHFDKAMEEISASISEDMSTLTAIRKFDEKYGDRKGRRKKAAALGFGGTQTIEKDSEAARVRKMEA